VANPILSLGEDATAALMTGLAFVVPFLAALLVVAVLGGFALLWRRFRRFARRS
jgi:hypothetical protein